MSPRIAIISGRYPESKFSAATNHKAYADRFNFSYIYCNWPTKNKNRYFNKIEYIKAYIDLFDYIFWIDDDAFFWNFEIDIRKFLPQDDHIFSACESPKYKEIFTFLSSGQFFLKNDPSSLNLLDQILKTPLSEVKSWWQDDLGYFTNGDQDLFVYLLKTKYPNRFKLYPYKNFNSRVDNLRGIESHKPTVLHFTGSEEKKIKDYAWVQNEYGLRPSLVSNEVEALYNTIYPKKSKWAKLRKLFV